jgi:hypothetical protein
VLFVLSLVAVILVGSYGDCKYYAKGCHWVLLLLTVVVARLVVAGVVIVRLDASFTFAVE